MTEPSAGPPGGFDRAIPSSLNTLYQEVILDHYRKPRNKGGLDDATHAITMNNPLCGDVIELLLRVEGGRIAEARFLGRGCSISQASASMLTGRVVGKNLDEAVELSGKFTRLLHGDETLLGDADLGDLRTLAGVSKFPVRIKCALLGWNCLEELADSGVAGGGGSKLGAGRETGAAPPRGNAAAPGHARADGAPGPSGSGSPAD